MYDNVLKDYAAKNYIYTHKLYIIQRNTKFERGSVRRLHKDWIFFYLTDLFCKENLYQQLWL